MILDRNRVYDGWDNLAAGMDAGRRPSLIDVNQCSVARDVVFRGGVPKSRPGIKQLGLIFENEIQYSVSGPGAGPNILTDAELVSGSPVIRSVLANFIQLDIGTLLTGTYGIPDGTTILSVEGPTSATMSANATETTLFPGGPSHLSVVTRPVVTGATGNFPNLLESLTHTFLIGDVGGTVRVEWVEVLTPHSMPDDTTILALTDAHNITLSHGFGQIEPTLNVTLTFIDSARGPDLVVELVGRSRPSVIDHAVGHFPNTITSLVANFSSTDLGHPIQANWFEGMTPHNVGTDCVISSVIDTQNILISHGITDAATDVQLTLPDRTNHIGGPVLGGFDSTDAFKAEPFQCACYYSPKGIDECIMVTIGGRLFQVTPLVDTAKIREIQLDNRNRRTIKENWMVQADRYHITQDGESSPIIFDGITARRAGPDEIIVGTVMAYGQGRIVVIRGRDVFFGDLFGSHDGDPSDSILKFTETNFLSEGFPASIPFTLGDITAASFYPQQDTATGLGQLLVFTDRGAVTFDLSLERSTWKQSAFQQIALVNSTFRGQRAISIVNGDMWGRSDEGWRAYRQARAQITGWAQLPMSTEVSKWTNADTPNLLRYGSAINFDNRLIVTCNPVPNSGRLYHDGLLSLDFDVLSSFGQATRPAWDGHSSKLKTLQLVTGTFAGKHRAFAFGLDENNETAIYEITKNGTKDFDGPITSEIEFKSHNFNSAFNEKNLYGADIWVDEVTEPVTMDLSFRPDSSLEYLPWKTFQAINPVGECGAITCGMCPTITNGFAPRTRVGKPADDCDESTGRGIRRGYEFQPKLRWTGHAAIRRMRLQAMQEEEDPKAPC